MELRHVEKVAVGCIGNTARSPVFEALLRKHLTDLGHPEIEVTSFGLSPTYWKPEVWAPIQPILKRMGISGWEAHRSRSFLEPEKSAEINNPKTLVLLMEPFHKQFILGVWRDSELEKNVKKRLFTVRGFLSGKESALEERSDPLRIADLWLGQFKKLPAKSYAKSINELNRAAKAVALKIAKAKEVSSWKH